jgi:putative endonuclease
MHTGESRITTGKQGESRARAVLERHGYAILATRYRTRFGEIDIVCDDAGTTVFVEVKARRSARKGSAAEAVSAYKQRRLAAMALDYLAWTGRLQQRARFDVVAIDGFGTDKEQTRVIQNAFVVDRTL